MKPINRTSIAAIIGCISGIAFERYRNRYFGYSSLLAATPKAPIAAPSVVDSTISPIKPYEHKEARLNAITKHGYPSFDTIRSFDNFVLSYDRRNRTSNWVLEHLTPEILKHNESIDRKKCEFFEDSSIHPLFRPKNSDYLGSGYDRGHLAAAGNHKLSQDDCQQTFVLSNISPQVGPGFNRGIWNKLEQYVRFRAKKATNLWCCTGPLYLPKIESDGKKYVKFEVIGDSDVSVPTHFFKVFVVENIDGSFDLEAYVIQNKSMDINIPLRAFQVPIDSIERAAGFLLFQNIPKNTFKSINGNNIFLEKFDQIKR